MKVAKEKYGSTDQKLLSIFLSWIFTEFIPPLIANCFYVTEGEGTGSRVLYYRKEVWEVLRAVGEKQMNSHFVKVCDWNYICYFSNMFLL